MTDVRARLLSDGVWHFPLRGVNAFLFAPDGGEVTLIDAGTPWDADRIRSGMDVAGVDPGDVDRVLLTHYDLDHVGALGKLSLDAPAFVGAPDDDYLAGRAKPPLGNHKGALQRVTGTLIPRPPNEIRTVVDGDRVGDFDVYRTPGHTPGHVAYVHADRGVAFLGDLVTGDGDELGPASWFVCYDTAENRRSVRDLAARVSEFEVAAMGHGAPLASGGHDALRRLAGRS